MRGHLSGLCGSVIVALLLLVAPAAPALAEDGDAIAIVNGRPISRRQVVDVLIESHGLQILQQLIVLDLAKAETARYQLRVTAGDIDRESDLAVAKLAPDGKTPLTPDERKQALEYLLREKGLSMAEFRIGMERNAHLRKLVERELKVDEATLREEFRRQYGEKVEVRHVQVSDTNGLHTALNLLDKGTDFAEVARQVSQDTQTAKNGGLVPPFAFNDDSVAPALREAAFALKPGERTNPIRVGRSWFILKLERRLPPADVKFEDVRTEVEQKLRDRVVPEEMNRLVTELFQKAEIRVLDRDLKTKFDELMKQNAASEAAAP